MTAVMTTRPDDLADHLAHELRATAEAMAGYRLGGDTALRPLHDLSTWCEAVLASAMGGAGVVVPLYLLSRLLDDVLDNLTGDFRYDPEAHELKVTFIRALVDALGELGEAGFENPAVWTDSLRRPLDGYLEVLERLNVRAEEQLQAARNPAVATETLEEL